MSTFANKIVTKAQVFEPIYGFWVANIEADSEEDITGQNDFEFDGVTWTGTVVRGRVFARKWMGRVVGGAGAMGTLLTAKNYIGVNVRAVIDDLMSATGETLDATNSDATILSRALSKWHRAQVTAGSALLTLMDTTGSTGRMQRTGQLKIGAEAFADTGAGTTVISYFTERNVKVVAPDTPLFEPGQSFEGDNITFVTTAISKDGLRQHLHLA